MTVSDAHSFDSSSFEPLRAKRGWIVALGVIYLLAGIVALSSVALATVVSVFIVGIAMLVAGVAEVINAFQVKSWGKFALWLALGLLYTVTSAFTLAKVIRDRGEETDLVSRIDQARLDKLLAEQDLLHVNTDRISG